MREEQGQALPGWEVGGKAKTRAIAIYNQV